VESSSLIFIDENEMDRLNCESPFYHMCVEIFQECQNKTDKLINKKSIDNPNKNHKLLYHFINQFSATLPIWTRIKWEKDRILTLEEHTTRLDSYQVNFKDSKLDIEDFLSHLCSEAKDKAENESMIFKYNNNRVKETSSYQKSMKSIMISLLDDNNNRLKIDDENKTHQSNDEANLEEEVDQELHQFKHDYICEKRLQSNCSTINNEIRIERKIEIVKLKYGLELSLDDLNSLFDTPNSNVIILYCILFKPKCIF
jgi:hypothetical protein